MPAVFYSQFNHLYDLLKLNTLQTHIFYLFLQFILTLLISYSLRSHIMDKYNNNNCT